MGYLTKIKRLFRSRPAVQQLPAGSITMNREGSIVTSTVSSVYPETLLGEIGRAVLTLFREARAAQAPLTELSIHYGSLIITARELRGGAVIFLRPHAALAFQPAANPKRL